MSEKDFEQKRRQMVETQIIARGITDPKVINAMLTIPRHLFVSESFRINAYSDMALPTSDGQTISQPYMVAVMSELLELNSECKVLEIGTGSGYQTAILATIAQKVYTIEKLANLSERARVILSSLGYNNIHFIVGDGTKGYSEGAPYDRILVTAGAPDVPLPLKEQLKDKGILIAPVGSRYSQQLIKIIKKGDTFISQYSTGCVFVPLLGEYGWKE
ncbi:MAG: protein-L-isoaspartate(D-aspartate) O-methyltransferase [Thermodesulfovibrionales bacterium]|nr:protein-L-isoaspartate(D-aspartate) O-methyltransferase [Thermodesulfovibrionales bacterium]